MEEKMGLETMTLVGHSLGAYFSIAYALKFPTRVSKLILLSPAGIPHDPNATSDPSRELTDAGDSSPRESTAEPATQKKVEEIKETQVKEKRQESRTRKLLMYLWEEGWSPFQVVRSSLFWGPMLVGKVSPCSRFCPGHNDILITLIFPVLIETVLRSQ